MTKIHIPISRLTGLLVVSLFIIGTAIPAPMSVTALQEEGSPLADQTWVRLGGPPGGIGYDIKVNPDNPDIMYVTDTFAGIHRSTNGGLTWVNFNEGIEARQGESGDEVPVFSVTVDPNDPNIVWVGLINKKGIYRSEDGGLTWVRLTNGIEECNIRGFAVEPGNSDVIYAAGEIGSWAWANEQVTGHTQDMVKGVVYKSTDAGKSWKPIWKGDNLARYVIIDPNNVNVVYVSTGIFDREASNSNWENNEPGGEGILKSYDGGENWERINNGLQNLYIGSLAMNPADSNILIAGAGNANYKKGSGIYITYDGGKLWELVHQSQVQITAVDFSPSAPNILYAASEIAFLRSDNGGGDWQEYTKQMGGWGPQDANGGVPIDIQVDPRNPLRIFVNGYGGGNIVSEDGGVTWSNASIGYTGDLITNLALDPNNPAIVYSNGKSGWFKSVDGGVSWIGILPAELWGTAYRGDVVLNPDNPNIVYFSNVEGSLYFSTNQGGDWNKVFRYEPFMWPIYEENPLMYFQGISSIEFAPSDHNRAYAGFGHTYHCSQVFDQKVCEYPTYEEYSLFISEDGGKNWAPIEGTEISGLTIAKVVVHPTNRDIVWVASPWNGVYKSVNGGRNWVATSNGLDLKVATIAINPQNPDILYAGIRDNSIFISNDGGASWQSSAVGMEPNETIVSIVMDPLRPNVIYAGGRRSGVYLSEDYGASWRVINTGLSTRSIGTLEISPDGLVLYAGTFGGGVFRLSTYDQAYFDSLAPTPTAIPTTISSSRLATETPTVVSTPAMPISTSEPSPNVIYIGGIIVVLAGVIAFTLWGRRTKGG